MIALRNKLREVGKNLVGFFPIRLFLQHLRQHFVLLFFWLILFGFITGNLGKSYGITYLFLFPEYMEKVGFISYALLGAGFGGFIMAFNISGYIIHARRFPFLATLSRPFLKFCINNAFIPLVFLVTYGFQTYHHLVVLEKIPWWQVLWWLTGFVVGTLLVLIFTSGYFFRVNKDLAMLFGMDEASRIRRRHIRQKVRKLPLKSAREQDIEVKTYLRIPWKIKRARTAKHYGQRLLLQVFRQHHVNGALFEVAVIFTLIALGLFRDIPAFQLPAGTAFFLLFTMLLMLSSAVHFVMGKYSTVFFLFLALCIHEVSQREWVSVKSYAYGLNYEQPISYHPDSVMAQIHREKPFNADLKHHKKILRRWKQKVRKHHPTGKKPKAVFIASSGGGTKAALWAFLCIQHADSALQGRLLDHTILMTGSSGGMMGAGYIRELYARKSPDHQQTWIPNDASQRISRDLLNPVATAIALHDLFIRWQTFTDGPFTYPKDRGYAFELKLNQNTDGAFSKRLSDYQEAEASARIPMVILTPTILNDAKRLIISPQPMSFMTNKLPQSRVGHVPGTEDVEFIRLFKHHGGLNLRFSSAIRMNASFPYILPSVALPTRPVLEIGDAGIRDNYGVRTALQYLFNLRDWFERNTSGIIILRIHDSRGLTYDPKTSSGLFDQLTTPVGSVANNLTAIHQQENDQLLQYAGAWYRGRIDVVDFRLSDILKDEISMSLHLTQMEKKRIHDALQHPRIRASVSRLRALMAR